MSRTLVQVGKTKLIRSKAGTSSCSPTEKWRVRSKPRWLSARVVPLPDRKTVFATMSSDALQEMLSQNAADMHGAVTHRAAIALGSNVGDKVGLIEQALHMMAEKDIRVLSVSPLYETKAMYYENQDTFINGACYVETPHEPLKLLDELQDIETKLGRVRTINKGPRTLDLDIILYDNDHILNERLEVPHKLLLEREFVLRPLADIVPHYTFPITFSSTDTEPQSVSTAFRQVSNPDVPMYPITTLCQRLPFIVSNNPTRRTVVMSILNITPDSFSDGGTYSEHNLEALQSSVRHHIAEGVKIFDVGGQSTRPKADLLTASEELRRVLPVIEAIRSMPEADQIAISVDTFYSQVARESVKYGADIINDVSAGLLDPAMLRTVANLDKSIILMHMRGNPHTMSQLTDYPTGVVDGVAVELAERVAAAKRAGIYPWRIILDPGIGFAKTRTQNLQLLKDLALLRARPEFSGYPWLLGVSRKGFIGSITGVKNAGDRIWGTAAAVTASIAGGADIVRVHDVAEMVQVSTMADAIYRTS